MTAADARIGTRVVVATPSNPEALAYTKVDADTWLERRNRRSRLQPQTNTQVQWWLDNRPEKTRVLDPILRGVEL